MGQVSGEFDHNPPNVRSRCILTKLYKAKKYLDQRERKEYWKRNKREKRTIPLYLPPRIEPEDKHLVNFQAISCWNVTILRIVLGYGCHLLLQNGYLKLTSHPISNKLIVWVNNNSYLSIFTFLHSTTIHIYIYIYIKHNLIKIFELHNYNIVSYKWRRCY